MPRPQEGWSTYIGESAKTITDKLGEPIRKGPSAYGFEWWVYHADQQYILVGVEKNKVKQVFLTGEHVDAQPFKIGQSIDELYRNTITDTEINIKIADSIFTLMLSEVDLQSRLLVMYDGVLAQLYFDHTTKQLQGIRFIDGETLVKQKPYDMTYVGTIIEPEKLSSFTQEKINAENAKQLFELTNIFRAYNNLDQFTYSEELNKVTNQQLKNIVMDRLAKIDSADTDLEQVLKKNEVDFEQASENIAENYSDAVDAVSGFINSEKHRKDLLQSNYNIVGTSAFEKNYAQIFIEK
ncbi:hypothetical protein DEX24_00430 [Kurthia sibirica]|uniref:Uncharacterized protein n=2 Tax=Kurthia sibirica TaxID=202750 RepID=A0A2U3AR56_9BACL|nr:hypothetical protein DEX24_00430 [Kurthia sibirica]